MFKKSHGLSHGRISNHIILINFQTGQGEKYDSGRLSSLFDRIGYTGVTHKVRQVEGAFPHEQPHPASEYENSIIYNGRNTTKKDIDKNPP
jgi:hypothetical protein